MSMRPKNILVTGPHRSGTTWIGNTLARSPGIRVLLEPFNKNFPPYGFGHRFDWAYTDYESSLEQPKIEAAFLAALAESPQQFARGVCRATKSGLRTPLRFAWHYWQARRNPRVLVKDPLALFSAGWLYERFALDVVCTTRSPWAFVASLKVADWGFSFKNFTRQNALMERLPEELAAQVVALENNRDDRIEKWCVLWNVLHHQIVDYQERYPTWHFLRYEDVALNPVSGFSEMLDFLGLTMTESIQRYIEDYTSARNPEETQSTQYQPRDARKTVESWRERLKPDEIRQISDLTARLTAQLYPDVEAL